MSVDVQKLRELEAKATKGPYSWTAEDHSMCTLHGKDYLYDHVLSVSPCKSCQKGATEWEWGRCTTPNKANADYIAAALNALPALLDEVERLRAALKPIALRGEISSKIIADARAALGASK